MGKTLAVQCGSAECGGKDLEEPGVEKFGGSTAKAKKSVTWKKCRNCTKQRQE